MVLSNLKIQMITSSQTSKLKNFQLKYIQKVIFILELGKMEEDMEMVFSILMMDLVIWESGQMIKLMDMVEWHTLMEECMKGCGIMDMHVAKEYFDIIMGQFMKEIGKMIYIVAKE